MNDLNAAAVFQGDLEQIYAMLDEHDLFRLVMLQNLDALYIASFSGQGAIWNPQEGTPNEAIYEGLGSLANTLYGHTSETTEFGFGDCAAAGGLCQRVLDLETP